MKKISKSLLLLMNEKLFNEGKMKKLLSFMLVFAMFIMTMSLSTMTTYAADDELSCDTLDTNTEYTYEYSNDRFKISFDSNATLDADGGGFSGDNPLVIESTGTAVISKVELIIGYNEDYSNEVEATAGTLSGNTSGSTTITCSDINAKIVTFKTIKSGWSYNYLQVKQVKIYYVSWPTSDSHEGCSHTAANHFYYTGTTYTYDFYGMYTYNGVEGRYFTGETYQDQYDGVYPVVFLESFDTNPSAGWYYEINNDGVVSYKPCEASYTITSETTTNGSFTVKSGTDVISSATSGTELTVTPSPNPGFVVDTVSWKKTSDSTYTEVTNDNGYKFTMPASKINVKVTFKSSGNYTLTFKTADENGTVSSSSLSNVAGGTVVTSHASELKIGSETITAIPNDGYIFYSWSGLRSDGVIVEDTTITATFKLYTDCLEDVTYTLTGENAESKQLSATAMFATKSSAITYTYDGIKYIAYNGYADETRYANWNDAMNFIKALNSACYGGYTTWRIFGSEAEATAWASATHTKGEYSTENVWLLWSSQVRSATDYGYAVTSYEYEYKPDDDNDYLGEWSYLSVDNSVKAGGFIVVCEYVDTASVTLSASATTTTVGETKDLTATITPINATDKSLTWTSSNENVAKVSDTGVVTGVSVGSATITAKTVNGNTATCEVTVNPGTIEVSATDGSATYNGSATNGGAALSVTTPTEGYTIKYGQTEGTYDLDSIPTFIDAKEYTVYYKVTAANYKDCTGSFKITIAKGTAIITVDTTKITKTYSEDVILPTATTTLGAVTCDKIATDLVNVGTYTVTYTVAGTDNYDGDTKTLTVEVTKTSAVITVDTTKIAKTYGEEVTLPEATTTFGEVTCDKTASDLVNAGTYTVTYTVAGTDNYDGATATLEVEITKASAVITVDTTKITKTYGEAVVLPTATTTFGEVTCDKTSSDLVNVGTYTVTYSVAGTDNYNSDTKTLTVTINKATYDMSSVKFENATYTYDGTEKSVTVTGTLPEGVTVAYITNKLTNAGTVTATAKFTGNENYNAIADMTATLTINKAETNATINEDVQTYEISAENIAYLVNGAANVKVEYYVNDAWTETAPTEAGTYNVRVTVFGDANHNDQVKVINNGLVINAASGLSGGAIAGIVIGSALLLALIIILVACLLKRRSNSKKQVA